MPKAQKGEHGSVVIRYGLLLFTVIVLFAGIMSFILLRFAAERFERYEVQTVQSGMQLAADDLENQCESLNEIASKIRVTSYYQPSIVCLDAYREIELLEDFVCFRNFSPVIDKYFLLYPEEGDGRQKIYISDGRVAYFSYYAKAAFGIREEETALLLRHLRFHLCRRYFLRHCRCASALRPFFLSQAERRSPYRMYHRCSHHCRSRLPSHPAPPYLHGCRQAA